MSGRSRKELFGLSTSENVKIAPAEGKLGVLIPGIGAVSTTFMAGVEAVKQGIGLPIGSLTQMATVRLGKRTEGRSPYIRDFVPLAGLEQLVFGGWDIFEDTAYEAARHRASSGAGAVGESEGSASGSAADEGGFRP